MFTRSVMLIMTMGMLLISPVAAGTTGRIAFTSDRGGNTDIYLMDMDGSNQIRLTNDTGVDNTPMFSPDGQKIAFFSNRSGTYQAYTMNWDGSAVQPVPNTQCNIGNWAAGRGLAWSPDGQKLLFKPTSDSLATINLDGSSKTSLISSGGVLGHSFIEGVEWGPTANDFYVNAHDPYDGYDQHIFRSSGGGTWSAITVDSPYPLHSHSPQVSGGLSRIVLDRNEGVQGPYNVYTMGLDGNNMTKLTFDTGLVFNCGADWASDGSEIVFSKKVGSSGKYQVWLMDTTGGSPHMLVGDAGSNNFAPSWTPVPEPATLSFLALGGLALFRRRRK